jgi:D-beta-D-heptose 7-phosphate kinase / D-beta-D-heptose 1-phosphate adenosyltransferase
MQNNNDSITGQDGDNNLAGASFEAVLGRFPSRRILVVGDLMLDRFSYGNVGRISPEAPAAIISLDRIEEAVGGAGNVARNIGSLDAHCDLLGMIGTDEAATAICRCLTALPHVEAHLVHAPERVTTVKSRFVAHLHNTHLLRADFEDTSEISPELQQKVVRIAAELMPQVDAVLLSDYSKGLLTDAAITSIIAHAQNAGKFVVVDPKGRNYERYAGADFITPNLSELGDVVGALVDTEERQLAAARKLLELTRVRAILVTRGENGVLVVPADGETASLLATARRVIDVSGAGDTLVAGFTLALASGASITNAARLANYAAGIAVSKFGTACVTHRELSDALLSRPDFHIRSKMFGSGAGLRQAVTKWREEGLVVGFTNGCFDIIHEGHIELLAEARSHCDRLIVAINSDASVSRLKGPARPIQSEQARAKIISALAFVDAVVTFDDETPIELIGDLKPSVLIKGADYTVDQVVGRAVVEANGGRVVLVPLLPDSSTTRIVEKMRVIKVEPVA